MSDYIKIRGARVHNLKNIDLDIPKNKLVVITGLSGSGKSSLAFDTLYAEGQRRYIESLSSYARQFLGVMQKPDVDKIEGISPAISIDQRRAGHNPRSTVGTITEIYDYLRLLFARVGVPHCPQCGKKVSRQTIDQIVEQILNVSKRQKNEIVVLGPVVKGKKGEHRSILEEVQKAGFVRVRINKIISRIEEALTGELDRQKKHNIEVVVDRLTPGKGLDRSRLVDSLETALKLGKGIVVIGNLNAKSGDLIFSEHFACEDCGVSLPELEPRLFSFNAPYGACVSCHGLGERLEVDPKLVVPNHNLSIAEGAIFPWAHASHKVGRQSFFAWQLEELAKRENIDLLTPVKNLSKEKFNLIFYGYGNFKKDKKIDDDFRWEGVTNWLERKYHEAGSEKSREEIKKYMVEKDCEMCQGKRLKPEVLAITIMEKSINDIAVTSIEKTKEFFENLLKPKSGLKAQDLKLAMPIIKEIINRLQFLIDVGLNYLTIDRRADTLSGGEEQRIRLATQIGSKLTGVLYILDEPSVGLHARDQKRLIGTLKQLRDIGNTVLVVEHDVQTIKESDWVIDIGPGAGKHGGKVVFQGTPKAILRSKTLTGDYLSGKKKVEIDQKDFKKRLLSRKNYRQNNNKNEEQKYLEIKGAQENNLKNINVKIPLGKFVLVSGVSGSGKSSLVNDILAKFLMQKFYRAKEIPGTFKEILGLEHLNKVVLIDQSPIGRTPRSNPATYTGCFAFIRDMFTTIKEAKIRGYKAGRFSFNVKGGRCEACEGQGQIKIEMYFLPDVYQECQECRGKRFNKETLSIEYKGKNIAQILEMTTEEALEFFKNIPGLNQKLKVLNDVGLSYIQLGQPAPSLSGGEAQRIKLGSELSKKSTGKTLYILDEPTTGLHPDDIKKLLYVLKELVVKGNTVVCIEHNLDIIRSADWVIDLGPEGGEKGGSIVAEGTPKDIAKNKKSYTGIFLGRK